MSNIKLRHLCLLASIGQSALANALIIDQSVSASYSHQVNFTYESGALGPQSSIEPDWYNSHTYKTKDESAALNATTAVQANLAGNSFLHSYGQTSWKTREWYQPEITYEPIPTVNYFSSSQLTRSAVITNDTNNNLRLDLNYLLASGAIGFYLPEMIDDEFAYASFYFDLSVNNNSIWSSGGSMYVDSNYPSIFEPHLSTFGAELNGGVSAWSHLSGEHYDTPMNFWSYNWNSQFGNLNLGELAPGESLEVAYRYVNSVSGRVTHCVPTADPVDILVGCADVLAFAHLGSAYGSEVAPLDDSTIRAVAVPEPSSLALLFVVLGMLIRRASAQTK